MAEFGAAGYGAARAVQDFMRDKRAQEAHETDQQIRQYALERRRQTDPREDLLMELRIDATKMDMDQRKKAFEDAQTLLEEGKRVNYGISVSRATGDWENLASELRKLRPEMGQIAIRRNSDPEKSLSIIDAEGQEVVKFKGRKLKNAQGAETDQFMSPDDEMTYFATNMLNPAEAAKNQVRQWEAMQKQQLTNEGRVAQEEAEQKGGQRREEIQQQGALAVRREAERGALQRVREQQTGAGERADTAAAARILSGGRGGAGGAGADEKALDREHNRIPRVLNDMLKPENSPSGFSAAYSYEHDKALRPLIEEALSDQLDEEWAGGNRTRARGIARKVIDETRQKYLRVEKEAKKYAGALAKRKVKPSDLAAVEAAAQKGDEDAKKLMGVYKVTSDALSPSVAKYLFDNLSSKPAD